MTYYELCQENIKLLKALKADYVFRQRQVEASIAKLDEVIEQLEHDKYKSYNNGVLTRWSKTPI